MCDGIIDIPLKTKFILVKRNGGDIAITIKGISATLPAPLAEMGIKKEDVNLFWSRQPFDLELPDYDGNCKICFKKAKRKILTQIKRSPEDVPWIKDMEVKYENVKPEGAVGNEPTRFFREGESIDDLIEESKLPFEEAVDKSRIIQGAREISAFDIELDKEEECANSCEPF